MKNNYLIFSLIFITSSVLIISASGYWETREFSMSSDFSKDLRIDLPEYTYEEYEPEPHGPGLIGYRLVFNTPLPESSKEILSKERKGWESTSDTTYRLNRKTWEPDFLTAEINTSSGEANLEYSLNIEWRGYPILTLLLTGLLFAAYILISFVWLCCKVINKIRNNRLRGV